MLESISWSADTIVDYAIKGKYGLIVIASQGHGFFGRFFLVSVAEHILRQSACPVLIVPARLEAHKLPAAHLPFRNIVATTDFSGASLSSSLIALHEAKRAQAELTLLHVVESPYRSEFMPSKIVASDRVEQLQTTYIQGLEQKLKEILILLEDPSISSRLIHKSHSIANSIAEYLTAEVVDLLIVSSHGMSNSVMLLGGVIEKILRQSPCPVLVVPPNVKCQS